MTENQNPLGRLQNAPHHIKVRWLIFLSVLAMAIVIAIWLISFPTMVAIAPPATEANPNPEPQARGLASLIESILGGGQ